MRKHRIAWWMLGLMTATGFVLAVLWFHRSAVKPDESTVKPDDADATLNEVVRAHVLATEGWPPEVYTIENTHRNDAEGNAIVNVIHKDDLKNAIPGGGKSIQLHVDGQNKRVIRTLHFQ